VAPDAVYRSPALTSPPQLRPDAAPLSIPDQAPPDGAEGLLTTEVTVPGYEIVARIAEGGMGTILRGRDPHLGRELAIKVLRDDLVADEDAIRRFVVEAQICGQLQHPNIIPVHQLGRLPNGLPFFTMKLVRGRTLTELLRERKHLGEDQPRFLRIFVQIVEAIAYAHSRGVIHRDLKPSNIMVGQFGELQVMDWGLAKVLDSTDDHLRRLKAQKGASGAETQAGDVLGTPAYMAPEQARGDVEEIDECADVFSLGAILCEILTGDSPYALRDAQGRPISATEALAEARAGNLEGAMEALESCDLEEQFAALAMRCLNPDRWQRPADAQEMAEVISTFLPNDPDWLAVLRQRTNSPELKEVLAQTLKEDGRQLQLNRATYILGIAALATGLLAVHVFWWIALLVAPLMLAALLRLVVGDTSRKHWQLMEEALDAARQRAKTAQEHEKQVIRAAKVAAREARQARGSSLPSNPIHDPEPVPSCSDALPDAKR
jgi:serine/threonine protein kinase